MTTKRTAPPTTPPPPVRVNVPLPGELHRKLRIRCAVEDMAIQDAVVEAIEAWVS